MSILPPPRTLDEPIWLPAPECLSLPANELHIWRVRMEEPRWTSGDQCPVFSDRTEKLNAALARNDILKHYAGRRFRNADFGLRNEESPLPGVIAASFRNPKSAEMAEGNNGGWRTGEPFRNRNALQMTQAQCDHLALIAVSRNVREVGLDLERVRDDIPFEEMANGFLDARSQWDLRVTWSPQEKAWKFFQFWTSNEACAQVHPSPPSSRACRVREFSPEADFIAALAVDGEPEARVHYWDWAC